MPAEVLNLESKKDKLQTLARLSDLLDNKFRIPGTQIRFGFDFLIGLIPYAGDIITFSFSGMLIMAMVKHGASGMLVLKMIWNILIDMIFGAIPFFGDLFDLHFKANRRNYNLLKEHYVEGAHQGSAWPVILIIIIMIFFLMVASVYVFWKLLQWIVS